MQHVDEILLPIFRAKTVETDNYEAGELVEGDFVYSPAHETEKGLKFCAGYEIWSRRDSDDPIGYRAIDPTTLEISTDSKKTWWRIPTSIDHDIYKKRQKGQR